MGSSSTEQRGTQRWLLGSQWPPSQCESEVHCTQRCAASPSSKQCSLRAAHWLSLEHSTQRAASHVRLKLPHGSRQVCTPPVDDPALLAPAVPPAPLPPAPIRPPAATEPATVLAAPALCASKTKRSSHAIATSGSRTAWRHALIAASASSLLRCERSHSGTAPDSCERLPTAEQGSNGPGHASVPPQRFPAEVPRDILE